MKKILETTVIAALSVVALTAIFAAAGFALSFAWHRSMESAFGLPPLSAREAVYLLLTVYLLTTPVRK